MSSLDLEQTIVTQKAGLETTFGFLSKAFAGFEKFVSLNAQALKSTLAENQEIAAKALSVKDLQDLFALQASQVQPAVEKAQSYWRHAYEITAGIQAEFTETVEAQFNRYQRDVQAVDAPTRSARPVVEQTETDEKK